MQFTIVFLLCTNVFTSHNVLTSTLPSGKPNLFWTTAVSSLMRRPFSPKTFWVLQTNIAHITLCSAGQTNVTTIKHTWCWYVLGQMLCRQTTTIGNYTALTLHFNVCGILLDISIVKNVTICLSSVRYYKHWKTEIRKHWTVKQCTHTLWPE